LFIPLSLSSITILLVVIRAGACTVSVTVGIQVLLAFPVLPFVVLLTPGVPTGKEQ
jgi:hypothetical protein